MRICCLYIATLPLAAFVLLLVVLRVSQTLSLKGRLGELRRRTGAVLPYLPQRAQTCYWRAPPRSWCILDLLDPIPLSNTQSSEPLLPNSAYRVRLEKCHCSPPSPAGLLVCISTYQTSRCIRGAANMSCSGRAICARICVYIFIYIHTHSSVYVHVYVHVCVCVCVCVYVHAYAFVYVCAYAYAYTYVSVHVTMYMYMRMYMCIYNICIYMYMLCICMCICMYIYLRICIEAVALPHSPVHSGK